MTIVQVDVITAEQPPATLGELVVSFNHSLTVVQQREGLTTDSLDLELLTILTADVLQTPVQSVTLVNQVGRFALVEYAPIYDADPQIIIFCDVGGAAITPGYA